MKYYEDGLYILSIMSEDIAQAAKKVTQYYAKRLKPAMEYLFSLGAPTPKILANIHEEHPVLIGAITSKHHLQTLDTNVYGKVYTKTQSKEVAVFKTKSYIVIHTLPTKKKPLQDLLEMQIFFREFKTQLHKYLNIHRKIWEDISAIKEKQEIKGKDVEKYRSILDSYQKTIRLIGNRIQQMGTYAKTRASLAKEIGVQDKLATLFTYTFEDLFNSLDYIKEIWKMTSDYVDSAIQIMVEIENKTSTKGLKSIQLLVSVGVLAGIIRYLNPSAIPKVTFPAVLFILGLALAAYGFDFLMKRTAANKQYKLKFVETDKEI